MSDEQFIPEKKTQPVEEVEKAYGLPPGTLRTNEVYTEFFHGYENPFISMSLSQDQKDSILEAIKNNPPRIEMLPHIPTTIDFLPSPTIMVATELFALEASKPVGVNDPDQPDYEQIAKACVEKARATTPFLLRELGLLPKDGEWFATSVECPK